MPEIIVKKRHLLLLLFASFLVTITVSLTTHLFEVPDENAHYATVHYLYDQKRLPIKEDADTHSIEEYQVEEIMGTLEGKNKYSYHPEYRIEQVEGRLGKYEEQISSLNTPNNTSVYEGKRAAIYPPLYYVLSQPFYYLASNGSLIERIFSIRILSILLTVATIFFVYKIGEQITGSGNGGTILSLLYLLYPMTTYVGGGINPDNLHNLFTTIFVYLSLRSIYIGWDSRTALSIGAIIGLDLLTKPQSYILLPITAMILLMTYKQFNLRKLLVTAVLIFLPILAISGYQEIPKIFNTDNPYIAESSEVIITGSLSFLEFSKGYLRTHLTEMPVWYWGVFKWFGLTLPKPFWWLATRVLALAAIGIVIGVWREHKAKKLSNLSKFVIFALGANLIYAGALFWFDWQFYQQFGRSLGLQARYYIPLLSTQLALIYLGIKNLTANVRYSGFLVSGLLIFFLSMHLAGFYTQLSGYYDFTSFTNFIDQLSQYKPWYAKGEWWYLWFATYVFSITSVVWLILKSPFTQDKSIK